MQKSYECWMDASMQFCLSLNVRVRDTVAGRNFGYLRYHQLANYTGLLSLIQALFDLMSHYCLPNNVFVVTC